MTLRVTNKKHTTLVIPAKTVLSKACPERSRMGRRNWNPEKLVLSKVEG
jgi:hypothetical protein